MNKLVSLVVLTIFCSATFAQTITLEMLEKSADPKNELLKEYDAYTASDGHTYKVGDEITTGVPSSNKTFAFLVSELGIVGGNPLLTAAWSGYKMQIKKIGVDRSKKRGATISMRCYLSGIGGIIVKFENALTSGEIVGLGMTRDKALEEIKKAKDMLELELISHQEFDSIKAECLKYIK